MSSLGLSIGVSSDARHRELCVVGTRAQLSALAEVITGPSGVVVVTGEAPPCFPGRIVCLSVAVTAGRFVDISLTKPAELVVKGGIAGLQVLADNVRALAEVGHPGDHLHVEYVPDHFYLVEGATPITFELASEQSAG